MKLKNFFKGFKKGLENFSQNISVIINSIFLSIVYLVGIGLTLILAKLFHKKFLDIKQLKKDKSYWSNLDLRKKPLEEYGRQF